MGYKTHADVVVNFAAEVAFLKQKLGHQAIEMLLRFDVVFDNGNKVAIVTDPGSIAGISRAGIVRAGIAQAGIK